MIADVHSSRTRLILSSSDDDILSEKKEYKKKKKSKWKQLAEVAQKFTTDGDINNAFQLEEGLDRNSPTRLSNRSYVVETPTFAVEDMKLLTSHADQSSKDLTSNNTSPSRLSRRSYTIDTPTIFEDRIDNTDMKKIKTPIPLPRRKSLNLILEPNKKDSLETSKIEVSKYEADIRVETKEEETVITLLEASYRDEECNISESSAVRLQESVEHTENDEDMPLAVKK